MADPTGSTSLKDKAKNWYDNNVDGTTVTSTIIGMAIFGLVMYGVKEFGGKLGKKAADVAQGK